MIKNFMCYCKDNYGVWCIGVRAEAWRVGIDVVNDAGGGYFGWGYGRCHHERWVGFYWVKVSWRIGG